MTGLKPFLAAVNTRRGAWCLAISTKVFMKNWKSIIVRAGPNELRTGTNVGPKASGPKVDELAKLFLLGVALLLA